MRSESTKAERVSARGEDGAGKRETWNGAHAKREKRQSGVDIERGYVGKTMAKNLIALI